MSFTDDGKCSQNCWGPVLIQNDSRMALLSGNEGSPIFTITGKIAALGAFGSFMNDVSVYTLLYSFIRQYSYFRSMKVRLGICPPVLSRLVISCYFTTQLVMTYDNSLWLMTNDFKLTETHSAMWNTNIKSLGIYIL